MTQKVLLYYIVSMFLCDKMGQGGSRRKREIRDGKLKNQTRVIIMSTWAMPPCCVCVFCCDVVFVCVLSYGYEHIASFLVTPWVSDSLETTDTTPFFSMRHITFSQGVFLLRFAANTDGPWPRARFHGPGFMGPMGPTSPWAHGPMDSMKCIAF